MCVGGGMCKGFFYPSSVSSRMRGLTYLSSSSKGPHSPLHFPSQSRGQSTILSQGQTWDQQCVKQELLNMKLRTAEPRVPQLSIHSGQHVVEDVECGFSFRPSNHPTLLKQQNLQAHNSALIRQGYTVFPIWVHTESHNSCMV